MTTIDTKCVRDVSEKRYDLLDADGDIQGREREAIILTLLDELERLHQWKAEAMTVHAEWEKTWEVAGRPGRLGASKAVSVRQEMERLRGETAWEYGLADEGAFEPYSDVSDDLDWILDGVHPLDEGTVLLRRRKAGPWERVEGDNDA